VLRRLLSVAVRAAFGVFLLGVFAASAYVAFNQWVRRGATRVPDLAGLGEDEAARQLADHGLGFRRAEAGRWSEERPLGRVIETRPRAGSLVKRGATIEAVLSLGARRVTVPELAGKATPAAQLTLRGEGLESGAILSVYAAAGSPGSVVGQDPPAGAAVPAGTAVDLLVAVEAAGATFVMPDLVYRRYDAVRGSYEAAGFRFGAVSFEPYEGVAEGTVLRQSPLPGHPLRRTDAIALAVAAPLEARP
jgi:serine/threonine-protein kinase